MTHTARQSAELALARWIDTLTSNRHSFAVDYAAYWLDGGHAPIISHYELPTKVGWSIMQRVQQLSRPIEADARAAAYYDKAIAEGTF